ncbi:unnamed protein product [Brachionus calyciflorus]|uniref:Uncharacterized protein n=1 Tax=Brachionus calyciflorus TaxID=104777 RepID=A0A814JD33_9BILA|nr:unnamed protein product [Brachionus calyciflorus]
MFNELMLFLFQACDCIFNIALTTIVVKVTVNLFNGQCGYGSHDKTDSVSNLKSPVVSNVKWTQETPERVRRDQLESFTVKPDLTRAWYDSDQFGYNWADRRNDDVIANSGKGLNFLNFDTLSRQRSSPHMQSEQQHAVPLPILNENKFNTWSTNPTNPFASTWCADDATREMKTPVNPFKACDMAVNNKIDFDRSVRNQDFTAVTPVSGNMMSDLRESELQNQNKKSRSKEWTFKPTFYTLLLEHGGIGSSYLLSRTTSTQMIKGIVWPVSWMIKKHMVMLFGWQPASQTDAVAEFYNRKQLPGLNEPSVFWRVDTAKPQTCAVCEAFDLVGQSYARLEILIRNKPTVEQRSVFDQTEFRTEQSFIPKRQAQFQTNNKQTTENLILAQLKLLLHDGSGMNVKR